MAAFNTDQLNMAKTGTRKSHGRSRPVKKKKREDMGTLKVDAELTSRKRRSAWKSSFGERGRKKFLGSSRKITNSGRNRKVVEKKPQRLQCRVQVEMMEMETKLAKMKEENRDWGESMVAMNSANQAEAKRELLVNIRNVLKFNLLQMKAVEASLMHQLGFF